MEVLYVLGVTIVTLGVFLVIGRLWTRPKLPRDETLFEPIIESPVATRQETCPRCGPEQKLQDDITGQFCPKCYACFPAP